MATHRLRYSQTWIKKLTTSLPIFLVLLALVPQAWAGVIQGNSFTPMELVSLETTQATSSNSVEKNMASVPRDITRHSDSHLTFLFGRKGGNTSAKSSGKPETGDAGAEEHCIANQFKSKQGCENCTVCAPGMQHDHQFPCGNGIGMREKCVPCEPGSYQEEGPHYSELRCRRCAECDEHAKTISVCTLIRNTVCGPCPKGMFYFSPNICLSCSSPDDDPKCAFTMAPNPDLSSPLTTPSSPPTSSSSTSSSTSSSPISSSKATSSTPSSLSPMTGFANQTGMSPILPTGKPVASPRTLSYGWISLIIFIIFITFVLVFVAVVTFRKHRGRFLSSSRDSSSKHTQGENRCTDAQTRPGEEMSPETLYQGVPCIPSASTSAMTTPNTVRTYIPGTSATDLDNILNFDGISLASQASTFSQPLPLSSQINGGQGYEEWNGPANFVGPVAMVNEAHQYVRQVSNEPGSPVLSEVSNSNGPVAMLNGAQYTRVRQLSNEPGSPGSGKVFIFPIVVDGKSYTCKPGCLQSDPSYNM